MFTLGQLAEQGGGSLVGDPGIEIFGVQPFELAATGDITLAAHKRYLTDLETTGATAVIVPETHTDSKKPLIRSANAKLTFARILALFKAKPFRNLGVSHLASVSKTCQLSEPVAIHPFVSIGDGVVIEEEVTLCPGVVIGDGCRIGAGSTLHPNVSLYAGVSVGKGVVLHSGTVIGADGFGYVHDGEKQVKIEQSGSVEIGDYVEIGANSCVDRAIFGTTVLESHVKLDNLVHVGHNCHIGENTVIVGCVGISGSVTIGKNCVVAGQAGVSDHVTIGDNVIVMQKTAVTKDIPSGSRVGGPYSRDYRSELKIQAVTQKLPEIYQEIRRFRKMIK
ncbi:MAG TPA: UDP-3-O-(3-hydroxymyristoyl)glucosamine N-acyltransferase [Acidobacteriota bacterium]|nr:UDP-3-O-(3-hydroxymyristoyl)glucosamine N-acyltransferase [Acidobacteriota bacterium]